MTSIEKQAILSIASIFALRMLGLFMLVPILSIYVQGLHGATPILIGIAIGCYGLTQAVLQIPLGICSDFYGRKPIIAFGLVIVAIGSALGALSHTIMGVILGRSLQGAGAVGSATNALLADLTQEKNRNFAMAIIGITIGCAFTSAMIIGPLLNHWFSIPTIFWITFCGAFFALFILKRWTPAPQQNQIDTNNRITWRNLKSLIINKELLRLNFSMLCLHAILSANFVVTPILLQKTIGIVEHQQWQVYLPSLLLGSISIIPFIRYAKTPAQNNKVFIFAIVLTLCAELTLYLFHGAMLEMILGLWLFFTGFTILETLIPSAVSKTVSAEHRGAAMGLNSTCQFLGIFIGGILAGYFYQVFNINFVYFTLAILSIIWLILISLVKRMKTSAV